MPLYWLLSSEHLDPLSLTDFDATRLSSRNTCLLGVFPKGSRHHEDAPGRLQGAIAHGSQVREGGLGDIPTSCQNHLFGDPPCFSPAQHWLPTCAFLVERKDASGRVEELPDPVSPQVCTRLNSLELEVLFGHFCQLVYTCLMLRTVCVGEVFVWDSMWSATRTTCDSLVFFHLCDWYLCCLL